MLSICIIEDNEIFSNAVTRKLRTKWYDVYQVFNLTDEYKDMYNKQVEVLLSKTNSQEFSSNYNKLMEIKCFQEVIQLTIDEVEILVINY